ncbi:glycosyltransferase family 4 protein [Flavobacterium jejuense]|uniref:Glycosyltransferase family 4 protein n=1 Tax=Flavobacterium jejuense TaxID=1544455 RepID=A0ABX0IQQ9_9FLAO|nr:glycosyltransferase family 4 protein [Flavobacterium jejuense]NHN26147.1 glycosyltransferase family 4 protein [Flavobacterium jejuense]
MKKLLYITNGIKGAGGLERVLSIKASALANNFGYEVHILVLNNDNDSFFYDFSEKIIIHDIKATGNIISFYKSYVNGVKNVVKDLKPDLISVCDDGLKGFFVPMILSKRQPIIYERHASIRHNTSMGFQGKIIKRMMRILAKKFSKFIVLTNSNKDEWPISNCEVIPNSLSFYPKESSSLNNKKVIVVGTHSYNKGYDLLLNAWKVVVGKHPTWSLDIYGKIDAQKTFVNLSKQLNISDSVCFYPPRPTIERAYLDASMLLLTSRTEGFGMVLIEAMACGLPCISFDCPSGPRDIINSNEDGFLVAPQNETELIEKIFFLIENEATRKKMGEKAKENVKRYLPENIMKQWDQLFKSVLK